MRRQRALPPASSPSRHPIPSAALTAVALVLAAAALLAMPPGARADRCRGQGQAVEPARFAKAERVTLCLINVHRAAAGVAPLPMEPTLRDSARAHSADMVARGYFDHTNPEGEGPTERGARAGYEGGVGENIQTRYRGTPLDFFEAFQASPGHDRNMLGPSYAVAGIGFADGFAPEEGGEGGPGVTLTEVFGVEPTAADDIALDLLVTRECDAALADRKRAKRKLRRAKRKIRRARRKGERAKLRRARRKKRAAKRALARARVAVERNCSPSGY